VGQNWPALLGQNSIALPPLGQLPASPPPRHRQERDWPRCPWRPPASKPARRRTGRATKLSLRSHPESDRRRTQSLPYSPFHEVLRYKETLVAIMVSGRWKSSEMVGRYVSARSLVVAVAICRCRFRDVLASICCAVSCGVRRVPGGPAFQQSSGCSSSTTHPWPTGAGGKGQPRRTRILMPVAVPNRFICS
jgi:hypothetical protein